MAEKHAPPPYSPSAVYPDLNQQQASGSYPTYAPNQIIEHQSKYYRFSLFHQN